MNCHLPLTWSRWLCDLDAWPRRVVVVCSVVSADCSFFDNSEHCGEFPISSHWVICRSWFNEFAHDPVRWMLVLSPRLEHRCAVELGFQPRYPALAHRPRLGISLVSPVVFDSGFPLWPPTPSCCPDRAMGGPGLPDPSSWAHCKWHSHDHPKSSAITDPSKTTKSSWVVFPMQILF
jgi:hypothetical protein